MRIKTLTGLYSLLLTLLALLVMLAGCQSTSQPDQGLLTETPASASTSRPVPTVTPPTPTATPVYLVPPEQLADLTIRFYHPWVGDLAQVVNELTAEFNQTNQWGIEVTATTAGSSMVLADMVENGGEGDSRPQVVIAPSEHLLTWLEITRIIRPLNDFISDPLYGLPEQQRAQYPLVFWQQDQVNGLQAGIPVQRDAPVIYYNQTWAAELGFTTQPGTMEEFREQACAAADAINHDRFYANDGTGGWIVNSDGQVVYSWLLTFGLEDALTGEPPALQFNQPAAEQTFTYFRSMLDEGCIWFARSTASNEYFANRQALMYTGNLTDLRLQQKTQSRMESTDEWTVIPFPDGDQPVTVTSGLSFGVLNSTPDQELAAWFFIRWMSQPANNARILAAGGGLPVNDSSAQLAAAEVQPVPLWMDTIQWMPTMQSVPTTSSWRIARFALQDAFWYSLQSFTKVEDIPLILEQLDATIAEVEAERGY